ncbi:MAG: 3-deoxy-manno-octulosonate cytidylyltransferase [Pseudomonadota bacterium]
MSAGRAAVVIPARFAATRLPGKPLLDIGGKPMIQRVFERASRARRVAEVVVATDDVRIVECVRAFGGRAVMTRADHETGSARCAEVAGALDADLIVNVQGDEPDLDPDAVDLAIAIHAEHRPFATTLAAPFPSAADCNDPSAVKAVLGEEVADGVRRAVYFSRAPVPYTDGEGAPERFLHIGLYVFSKDALARFAAAPRGRAEMQEKLEQLRILEHGETILAGVVDRAVPGVDTIDDLEAARRRLAGG